MVGTPNTTNLRVFLSKLFSVLELKKKTRHDSQNHLYYVDKKQDNLRILEGTNCFKSTNTS